jgi:hypothetical protein
MRLESTDVQVPAVMGQRYAEVIYGSAYEVIALRIDIELTHFGKKGKQYPFRSGHWVYI